MLKIQLIYMIYIVAYNIFSLIIEKFCEMYFFIILTGPKCPNALLGHCTVFIDLYDIKMTEVPHFYRCIIIKCNYVPKKKSKTEKNGRTSVTTNV